MYARTETQRPDARVQSLATELYSRRRPQLLRIARANAASTGDAEEALQEAFLSFINHYDPDSGAPPLAWLTLTLKRECWSKGSRKHLVHQVSLSAAGNESCGYSGELIDCPVETETSIEKAEGALEARRHLAQLKPDERTALLLFGLGYSYKEIAELRGWTYTKVNRCLAEGRAALQRRQRAG